MESVIRKWGNSPALRLPNAVLKAAGYRLEQKVELTVSRGRIVIRPIEKVEYDLEALVDGIKPDHLHDEASFGEPVGKEALQWRGAASCPRPVTSSGSSSIRRPATSRQATVRPW